MSHAQGVVLLADRVLGYFEYNGTVDVAMHKIYKTENELSENWRKTQPSCSCVDGLTDVVLKVDSYDDFSWPAKACLEHLNIIEPLSRPY